MQLGGKVKIYAIRNNADTSCLHVCEELKIPGGSWAVEVETWEHRYEGNTLAGFGPRVEVFTKSSVEKATTMREIREHGDGEFEDILDITHTYWSDAPFAVVRTDEVRGVRTRTAHLARRVGKRSITMQLPKLALPKMTATPRLKSGRTCRRWATLAAIADTTGRSHVGVIEDHRYFFAHSAVFIVAGDKTVLRDAQHALPFDPVLKTDILTSGNAPHSLWFDEESVRLVSYLAHVGYTGSQR